MKILKIIFLVVIIGSLLTACAATKEHFNVGEPSFTELPEHLHGTFRAHYPPGNHQQGYQPASVKASQPYIAPTEPQLPPPLSKRTKKWLDKQILLHQRGNEVIASVKAVYPTKLIPRNHRAYAIQAYLIKRGVGVKIVPFIKTNGNLESVRLGYR